MTNPTRAQLFELVAEREERIAFLERQVSDREADARYWALTANQYLMRLDVLEAGLPKAHVEPIPDEARAS